MDALPTINCIPDAEWIIASRSSRLAAIQTQSVANNLYPHINYKGFGKLAVKWVVSRGEQVMDCALKDIGDHGLFTKAVDQEVINGTARLAVHSAKDMPTHLDKRLVIAAVPARQSAFDAFVSDRYSHIDQLPSGAKIGTASVRRSAQLKALYPHLHIALVRGNVGTRLKKLYDGGYAALILAEAGLKRLGLAASIQHTMAPQCFVPAGGQGTLAVTARRDDHEAQSILQHLDDPLSRLSLTAERRIITALDSGCQTPLGINIHFRDDDVVLDMFTAEADLNQPRWLRFEGNRDDVMMLADEAIKAVRSGAGSAVPLV